ncbi:hypothetical protein LCGC14_1490470 [marine sediment metagenome]|uniref:Peptidase C14 caspase domain-containing protein n=1 Tax=marine sediment metagenome TaxID=412755 RepID=A0A0F9J7J2_9ZZZZ
MGKKWAFLVGISDYDHREFNRLSFANTHVSDFEDILWSSGEFEEGSIITLKSNNLPEKRPNRTHIINEFNKLLKKLEYKNTLFIYFVCHGGFFNNKNYIFPLNANKDDDDILKDTSLSIEWFTRRIKRYESESWKVYYFIDACRDQLGQSSFGKKLKKGVLDDKKNITTFKNLDKAHLPLGINYFFSCCEGEKSWHFSKDNRIHSIFSYALIEGLREKINPPIYLDDLIIYVKDEVESIVKREGFPIQRPHDPIPNKERDQIILGESYEDERMGRLLIPEFQKKLEIILNEYNQSIESLIAINIVDRNGKVLRSVIRNSEQSEAQKINQIINSKIIPILKKSKKINSNSFPETLLTEGYRIISRVAEPEIVFLTILDTSTKIDHILQNADIAVKFITQAFNGLSIVPEFPKIAQPEPSIKVVEKVVYKKKKKKDSDNLLTFFDDAINLVQVLILYKGSGTCIYFKSFGSEEIDPEMMSGFLSAISVLGRDFLTNEPFSEISYGNRVLLLSSGEYVKVSLVSSKYASPLLRNNLKKFISVFEREYQHVLPNWRGQLSLFRDTGIFIDEVFNTSIIEPHEVAFKSANVKSLKNNISKKIIKITQDIMEASGRNFVFIASILKEASDKTGKKFIDILKGITELRDKKILKPIDITSIGAQKISQQEIDLLTQKISGLTGLTQEEQQKLLDDLVQMEPEAREAYFASLTEQREIIITPTQFDSFKEAKKEIINLRKIAKKARKDKDYTKSLNVYQVAIKLASKWDLSGEIDHLYEYVQKTKIEELENKMKSLEKQAIAEKRKNNFIEAANMYINASRTASDIFKLGVVEMEKDVKRFNNLAIECEQRVESL